MKILFLDVDGVLNTRDILLQHDGSDDFDRHKLGNELLDRLESIINATKAKIVLSSTWRLYPNLIEILNSKFSERGFEIFDKTVEIRSHSGFVTRRLEIQEWLSRNKVSRFAIIDDDEDAEIKGNFFQTDFTTGLTETIMNDVIAHLLKG